ncbi:MAG: cupredoxin domain-containing protein [Thermoplasmata archaeon]|nr:cupredoxin domain-containing protein [Thermoplasmata archaeon]
MGQRRKRSALGIGLAAFLLAASLATLSGAVVAHSSNGSSNHPGATSQLSVSVSDAFAFSLNSYEVTPGDTVSITLIQLGTAPHTFTLSPIAGFKFDTSNSTTNLLAFFSAHPPLVNLSVPGTPGARAYGNFTAPALGLYEFVCLTAGHFSFGMWGILGSGEQGGLGSTDTGPGAAVFIIGGIIVALVVVAIVLGFYVGRRRGALHEMPPERLGYAENPTAPAAPKG